MLHKSLNNRAWINERESPESRIFNVVCKYWTLLLWKSFVEALSESKFCCFVLFQTIIIIVNRAGNRAMQAIFYFNCCDFAELLPGKLCFLRQSIVGLKLFETSKIVQSKNFIINSGVFTLVWSLNKEKSNTDLPSWARRAVSASFQF